MLLLYCPSNAHKSGGQTMVESLFSFKIPHRRTKRKPKRRNLNRVSDESERGTKRSRRNGQRNERLHRGKLLRLGFASHTRPAGSKGDSRWSEKNSNKEQEKRQRRRPSTTAPCQNTYIFPLGLTETKGVFLEEKKKKKQAGEEKVGEC